MKDISSIEVVTLIVSTITAVIALSVSIQQKRISRYTLQHDLFEKRYEVYDATYVILNRLILGVQLDSEAFHNFIKAKNTSVFLFSSNISKKLNEYYNIAFLKWYYKDFADGILPSSSITELKASLPFDKDVTEITKLDLLNEIHKYAHNEYLDINNLFAKEMNIFKKK